jgi:hypothetical protein
MIVRLATRALKALRAALIFAPPALRAADGLDRASREPFGRQLSTAAVEVLDDGQQRRYCLIIFAGCDSRPPPHRPMWSSFDSVVSGHCSFFTSQVPPGLLFVRRHVREPTTKPDCASASGQAQIRSRATPSRSSRCHGDTPVRRRLRQEPHPVRPLPPRTNEDIDAQNGQAYHGRKTTTPNGTRPAELGSRSCQGQRTGWQRRRFVASRVRSCPGEAGSTRVLRAGAESARANDSMRCKT